MGKAYRMQWSISLQMEWNSNTRGNTDEPQRHHAKLNRLVTQG